MSEVLHANIFFLITGIAVIVFSLLLCIALYHVIKILKSIRKILDRVEAASEMVAEDISHIRSYLTEGSLFSYILSLFFKGRGGATRSRRHSKSRSKKGTTLAITEEE